MIPDVPIVGSAVAEEKDPDQKHIGWYEYTGGTCLHGLQYTKQRKVCYNIIINVCILNLCG